MKYFFLILVTIVTLISTNAQTDIRFESSALTAPGEVYLGFHRADQKFVEDTLQVGEGGIVNIKSDEGYDPGLYFLYQPNAFYQEFIINEPQFSIKSDGQDYAKFYVEGSVENEVFRQFQLELGKLQRQRSLLSDSLNHLSGEDSIALRQEIIALGDQSEEARKNLYEKNPDLLISKMIRLMSVVPIPQLDEIEDENERKRQEYMAYRQAFLDRLDFQEEGLLRTPVFRANVLRYINEVAPQIPDSLKIEVDKILTSVADNPVSFRYWLVTFTNEYQNSKRMGMDAVLVHLLKKYYLTGKADWVDEESLKKMREEVAFLEPNQIGKPAPKLDLVDTLYAPMSPLQELAEEFIVLYFYDPDCGHCKKKTPLLRDAYYDLKDLGAEVVAVCTISDVEKWKKYIRDNELDWINLADPNSQSRFKVNYDIRSTPRVYILDKERKIIAKRLDVEQIADFITNYKQVVSARADTN